MPEKRPTRDIKGHQLGSPRERRGGRSSTSGKSLGFLVCFPSQVVPSSTQRAQVGGLWLSTPGREGPRACASKDGLDPGKGFSPNGCSSATGHPSSRQATLSAVSLPLWVTRASLAFTSSQPCIPTGLCAQASFPLQSLQDSPTKGDILHDRCSAPLAPWLPQALPSSLAPGYRARLFWPCGTCHHSHLDSLLSSDWKLINMGSLLA